VYSIRDLTKTYAKRGRTVTALASLTFQVERGDFWVVYGPSGSGKSTLLLALGGMLRPTSGLVAYENSDIYKRSSLWRNRFRKFHVGFVFQRFFLVPYLTVMDNIRMPLRLRGSAGNAAARAAALAERFRIEDRLMHKPPELSVGEQQRVAMARALICDPDVILADEPTGNLDGANAGILADCLREENRKGRTILLVTHDESLLDTGTRKLSLTKGGQEQ